MPFIISRVNVPVAEEQELQIKSRLGKAIELVPGKSEASLMVCFEEGAHLYLRGDGAQPVAYLEVSVFGNERHDGYEALTAEIARIYHDVLGVAPDRVYVRYDDIRVWGVGGVTLDRTKY